MRIRIQEITKMLRFYNNKNVSNETLPSNMPQQESDIIQKMFAMQIIFKFFTNFFPNYCNLFYSPLLVSLDLDPNKEKSLGSGSKWNPMWIHITDSRKDVLISEGKVQHYAESIEDTQPKPVTRMA